MLPELLHAKYRGNNTTYRLKHETRHKANVRTMTVFMIMTAITTHLKKCLKKEEKLFLELGTKT